MKKVSTLTFAIITVLIMSCASSKLAIVPVGSWDYKVTGTPAGDYKGVLMVSYAEGKYTATFKGDAGELPLRDAAYDKKSKKLTGNFDFDGNTIFFDSITAGDSMTGSVSAGGASFPFTATRKK